VYISLGVLNHKRVVEVPVKEIIIAPEIPIVLLVVWVFALVQVFVAVTVTPTKI